MNSKLNVSALVAVSAVMFLSACSNYQEEFDNNFGALEYADDVVESSPSGGDDLSLSSGGHGSSSSSNPYVIGNVLTDARDGKEYKLVTVGEQKWMAENLNFETEKSRCYDNANENCLKYGRLYTWADAQDVCPAGTHLPSYDEFNALYKYVREEQQSNGTTEAKFLKSKEGWKDYNGKKGGDDTYGFSALPAGLFADTGYVRIGEFARFLTSDTTDDGLARTFGMDYNNTVFGPSRYTKTYAFSVRCLVGEKKAEATSSSSMESSSSFKLPSVTVSTVNMHGADYAVVTIGEQTWMAKSMEWQEVESFCYMNMGGICNDRGRFYKWEQAENICPEGWRLPDSSEWQTLFDAVGGKEIAGKVLKSIGGNGSNEVEFNALLAGYMNSMNEYNDLDEKACFWVADGNGTKIVELQHESDKAYFVTVQTGDAYSVRCIKGAESLSSSSAPCYTDKAYDSETEFCFKKSIYKKCGGKAYDPEMEYCRSENNSVQQLWNCEVEGAGYYNPESLYCDNVQGLLHLKACGDTLIRQDEYCYRHGKSAIQVAKMESCAGTLYNPLTTFCHGSGGGILARDICSETPDAEDTLDIDLRYNIKENTKDYEELCDLRDKHVYGAQKIGDYIWMTQNLNYDTAGSYRPDDNRYSDQYGRYYTWNTAMAACPKGWHLPSKYEFEKLIKTAGGEGIAGKNLKSTSMWHSSGAGIDDFGFAALPAGVVDNKGDFYNATNFTYFWSSEDDGEPSSGQALKLNLSYDADGAQLGNGYKDAAYSVRCVQGEFSVTPKSETILGRQYSVVTFNEEEGNMSDKQTWMAENLQYWDTDNFTSTEKMCFYEDAEYDQDKTDGVNLCEKYGRYYNQEEALSILNRTRSQGDCWVLPDSGKVKTLINIAGKDLSRLYSEQMGGNNKTGFNLLPAGYYRSQTQFMTETGDNHYFKTCFWIRTNNSNKLAAYCFYENDKAGSEMTYDIEAGARLPIRLMYDEYYCETHKN